MSVKGKTNGRKFEKGNPGGGRHKLPVEVKELAQSYTIEAIERLRFWMHSKNASVAVRAAEIMLNRGWGTPAQSINHTGNVIATHQLMTAQAEALLENDPSKIIEGECQTITTKQ